jgi:hypothetical protein
MGPPLLQAGHVTYAPRYVNRRPSHDVFVIPWVTVPPVVERSPSRRKFLLIALFICLLLIIEPTQLVSQKQLPSCLAQ